MGGWAGGWVGYLVDEELDVVGGDLLAGEVHEVGGWVGGWVGYLVDEELDVVGGDLLAGEVHEVVHVDVHELGDDIDFVEGGSQGGNDLEGEGGWVGGWVGKKVGEGELGDWNELL